MNFLIQLQNLKLYEKFFQFLRFKYRLSSYLTIPIAYYRSFNTVAPKKDKQIDPNFTTILFGPLSLKSERIIS